jgi:Meiotically up-regulated gene 113
VDKEDGTAHTDLDRRARSRYIGGCLDGVESYLADAVLGDYPQAFGVPLSHGMSSWYEMDPDTGEETGVTYRFVGTGPKFPESTRNASAHAQAVTARNPALALPQHKPRTEDHLYVIGQDERCSIVKLGHARDPEARLRDLQVGNPQPLKVLALFEGYGHWEPLLHQAFSAHRLAGEWFDLKTDDPAGTVREAMDKIREAVVRAAVTPPQPRGAGRVVAMATKLSRAEVALIDAARGHIGRSEWLRNAALAAAIRQPRAEDSACGAS